MFSNKTLKNLILIFLGTYPLFDIGFFYNNVTTVIRMALIIIFVLWTFFVNKESRKYFKYMVAFYTIILVFSGLHHLNAQTFTSLVPGNFNYNWLYELVYIFKMTVPFLMLFILKHISISKKEYINVVKVWVIFIAGSIIFTNLFKISLGSYSGITITGNIFNWLNPNFDYFNLASKGFFKYANQTSSILVCLLPVVYYLVLKRKLNCNYLLLILTACLMLGTRVSGAGCLLVLFTLVSIYLFFVFKNKMNFDFKFSIFSLVLVILFSLVLPVSPSANRLSAINFKRPIKFANDLEIKEKYILANYEEKEMAEQFIFKSYPYYYDPQFWYDIMQLDRNHRVDYRFLEISMVKRVIEINNNKFDMLFGITNSRIQHIFNIERDFVLQFYAYGLIGSIILLGGYFIMLGNGLKNILKKFDYKNIICVSIVFLFLFTAYLSGNILNQLAVPIMFMYIIKLKDVDV